jgi:hypothetical protein
MVRLNVLAEGQTEEAFVYQVLAPYLADYGVVATARCVTTRRDRRRPDQVFRGGFRDFSKALRDLQRWMAEDRTAFFTTMFDLYALPTDFPEYVSSAQVKDPYARVRHLEQALGSIVGDRRMIPYIQLHEFEALLLTDPAKFEWHYVEHGSAIDRLIGLSESVTSPETINDSPETAPSKRIVQEIPEYQKAVAGPIIAQKIGIDAMRARCPHVAEWVKQLEALGRGEPRIPGVEPGLIVHMADDFDATPEDFSDYV